MNRLKKLIIAAGVFILTANTVFASNIDSLIQKSQINKTSTISISVKDAKSGRNVYSYNSEKLMNPASVLKIFTMRAAYKELGPDYKFKTSAFIDKKHNLYIKLSGDPTLTTDSLKHLFELISSQNIKKVNDIIIDSTVIDNEEWGTGWMWDDDTSFHLPKYSPFTINENLIDITIEPSKKYYIPYVSTKGFYDMKFVNLLTKGSEDKITFERKPWQTGDTTYLKGTVKNTIHAKLPVDNPQKHFVNVLTKTLSSSGISKTGQIKIAPVQKNAKIIAEHSSKPLEEIIADTLKNSNNLYSEMIFKTAGGHFAKTQGTTKLAISMLEKQNQNINSNGINIVDGCGISRNDLITAQWATDNLNQIYKDKDFYDYYLLLPKPIEGTLSNRLLDISLNLRAKTGTASGISSIAGFIKTKDNKQYSFAIFIQNFNQPTIEIKQFEDELIKAIYEI